MKMEKETKQNFVKENEEDTFCAITLTADCKEEKTCKHEKHEEKTAQFKQTN